MTIFIRINKIKQNSIATRYGLDGPGIESRWGEVFRTRPDRLWGPPTLRLLGDKAAETRRWPPTLIYNRSLRKSTAIHLLPLLAFMSRSRLNFTCSLCIITHVNGHNIVMHRDLLNCMTLKCEEQVEKHCLIKHHLPVNNGFPHSISCLKGPVGTIAIRRL
jgi:hypothetical protein